MFHSTLLHVEALYMDAYLFMMNKSDINFFFFFFFFLIKNYCMDEC